MLFKGEEAKERVASGGGHFRATSDELGLPVDLGRGGRVSHFLKIIFHYYKIVIPYAVNQNEKRVHDARCVICSKNKNSGRRNFRI